MLNEARTNEQTQSSLTDEIEKLKSQLAEAAAATAKAASPPASYLTNSSSALTAHQRVVDENTQLHGELSAARVHVERLETSLGDVRRQHESCEKKLTLERDSVSLLEHKLSQETHQCSTLRARVDDCEHLVAELRTSLSGETRRADDALAARDELEARLGETCAQLTEKSDELESLRRENAMWLEKTERDEARVKALEKEAFKLRFLIDDLNRDLEMKNAELARYESLVRSKELELGDVNDKLVSKEHMFRSKLEDYEKNRADLAALRLKYSELGASLNEQLSALNKHIAALTADKQALADQLDATKAELEQINKRPPPPPPQVETTDSGAAADSERVAMLRLENQALSVKYEAKVQYLEVEINTLRARIQKLLKVSVLLFLV